jgi:hypothetical protein
MSGTPKKPRKKVNDVIRDERTFMSTVSQFLPGYEQYLDYKDIIQGAATGNKTQLNQGVLGIAMPFAGKALTGGLDYVTEKTLGKKTADDNQNKREGIMNLSTDQLQKLYKKYGGGGYDKWKAEGFPAFAEGGSVSNNTTMAKRSALDLLGGPDDPPIKPARKPLTSTDMANWNKVVEYAGTKKLDPTKLDHDQNIGYGVIDEWNKANPKEAFDRNRVQDVQEMMLNYRNASINRMKKVPAKYAGDLYKNFGDDFSNFMPGLSKADNFPGSKTLSWKVPAEYMAQETASFAGPKKGFAPVTTGTIPQYAGGGGLGGILKKIMGGEGEEGGDDENDKAAGMMNAGMGVLTDTLGAATNTTSIYGAGARGKAIGGGIGAAAGALFGSPEVGQMLGSTIGGLIGGNKDKKAMDQDQFDMNRRDFANKEMQPNMGKYGNQFAEGGATGEPVPTPEQQGPAMRTINVEKNELMVDPTTGEVVQKFTNPNRFAAHQKKQMKEPVGNFVQVPDNLIIIPKKLAGRYERGDKLARASIMRQLLSDQENDPMHNMPADMKGAEQFGDGGGTGPGLPKGKSLRALQFQNWWNKQGGELADPETHKQLILKEDGINGPKTSKLFGDINGSGAYHAFGNDFNAYEKQQMDAGIGDVSQFDTPITAKDKLLGRTVTTHPMADLRPQMGAVKNPTRRQVNDIIGGGEGDAEGEGNEASFGKIARKAVSNLPILAQMAINSQGDPFLQRNTNNSFDTAIGLANELPEDVSIAANLAANDNALGSARKAIDNNDTPSARAEAAELHSRGLQANNAVYGGREQARNALRSQKLNAIMGLEVNKGADLEQASERYMNEQRMDKAARENNTMAGLTNLTVNNLKASNDEAMVDAMNSMTHFFDVDPYGKKMLREDPKAVSFMVNYMAENKGTELKDAVAAYESAKKKKVVTNTTTKEGNTKTSKTVTE